MEDIKGVEYFCFQLYINFFFRPFHVLKFLESCLWPNRSVLAVRMASSPALNRWESHTSDVDGNTQSSYMVTRPTSMDGLWGPSMIIMWKWSKHRREAGDTYTTWPGTHSTSHMPAMEEFTSGHRQNTVARLLISFFTMILEIANAGSGKKMVVW